MKRRVGTAIGLLLTAVLAWIVWQTSGPREPVFEGRTLSSWLERHVPTSAADPPYNSPGWRKADEALRRIGTNAIPTLLEMISARDRPPFVRKLMEFARRRGWTHWSYRYAMSRHEEAEYAFQVLGANAVSAVPELIRIYEANLSPSSQRCAALALGHIGHDAQAAIPVLIRDFTHSNANVRFYAVSAVMHIGGKPEVVLPALVGALKDPDINVRWNALVGLSNFGGRARPAVPEILRRLDDPGMIGTSPIREQVETALWRIAPEKVGKPLIVEDATPIITNGATTEALQVAFKGEQRTLIPAGAALPVVRQFWNSDPRPRLALYRGAGGPEGNAQFLGQFEVMDLPGAATDNLNVSTLCVIADGQIVLCARDNNRNLFLEIRRVENGAAK